MKILVTGAYGQLGSEIGQLTEKYPDWNFLFTDVDSLDITDEDAVSAYFSENKPDVVINCAAYTAVDKAETDQETAFRINAIAPGILARNSAKDGAKFIHISTDYVFSGDASIPYSETDEVDPQGVYGRTKLAGEDNVKRENADAIIIRTAWLYSAFGNNFVKTMLRLGKERGELKVVFDQVGSPTNAADLSAAILEILNKPDIFNPGIYHYSNEGVASWYDFALAIFELSGIACKVIPVESHEFPTPTKRPHFSVLNKSKIKNTFGIEIPYWRDSLQVCLKRIEKDKNG